MSSAEMTSLRNNDSAVVDMRDSSISLKQVGDLQPVSYSLNKGSGARMVQLPVSSLIVLQGTVVILSFVCIFLLVAIIGGRESDSNCSCPQVSAMQYALSLH